MNIGIQSGLIEPRHEKKMGMAIWLYMWLVWRQTKSGGFVLGGMPLTYSEISKRSGFEERQIRRWLNVLRAEAYVEVTHTNYKMMRIRVLKSKKFNFKQYPLPLTENGQSSDSGKSSASTKNGQSMRPKTVNGVTKNGQFNKSGIMREIESTTNTEHLGQSEAAPAGIQALVPLTLWRDYVAMRKAKHKPLTDGAILILTTRLLELQASGENLQQVVEQSVMNAWTGFFPVKGSNGHGREKESFADKQRRESKEAIGSIIGGAGELVRQMERQLPDAQSDKTADAHIRRSAGRSDA